MEVSLKRKNDEVIDAIFREVKRQKQVSELTSFQKGLLSFLHEIIGENSEWDDVLPIIVQHLDDEVLSLNELANQTECKIRKASNERYIISRVVDNHVRHTKIIGVTEEFMEAVDIMKQACVRDRKDILAFLEQEDAEFYSGEDEHKKEAELGIRTDEHESCWRYFVSKSTNEKDVELWPYEDPYAKDHQTWLDILLRT